eukprot:scaffold12.g8247.t1
MACVWNDWLPEAIAQEARAEESGRFSAVIDALTEVGAEQWEQDKRSKPIEEACSATLPWVPIVKTFLHAQAEPPLAAFRQLALTLLDIVLTCDHDLAAQSRWAALLHRILRLKRRKLGITVPWRPFYAMLRRHTMEPSSDFEGVAVGEVRRDSLVKVAHRARRFFPPGTGEGALGWLAMLMPTHEALRGRGAWGEWAPRWMELWQQVAHSHYWDVLWYNLFSRLAKHDVHGLVDWPALVPQLFTRFMWAFQVPVGTATANPPFTFTAPLLCAAAFATDLKSRSTCIAKAAVYLLGRSRRDYCDVPVGPPDEDVALGALGTMVSLLEQVRTIISL